VSAPRARAVRGLRHEPAKLLRLPGDGRFLASLAGGRICGPLGWHCLRRVYAWLKVRQRQQLVLFLSHDVRLVHHVLADSTAPIRLRFCAPPS